MAKATPKDQEDTVRRYLTSLSDPSQLVDQDRITKLQKKLDSTSDPLERVKLHNELEQAKQPANDGLEEEFVKVAKPWSDEQGVTAEAFVAEGVKPAVLRRAGFAVKGRAGSRSTGGTRQRRQGPRVSKDHVVEHVTGAMKGKRVTKKDIENATGGSTNTVKQATDQMVEAGQLTNVGKADHSGPGRAPDLFEVA